MSDITTGATKAKRRKLHYFEVTNGCTISEPNVPQPKVNADVFPDVSNGSIKDVSNLTMEISSCEQLSSHFGKLANQEAERMQDDLDSGFPISAAKKKEMRKLIPELASDPATEAGWRAWIKASKPKQLQDFIDLVDQWLGSPIDWNQMDYVTDTWSDQAIAMQFFESENSDVLEALQIEFVYGASPGSSYCVAELGLDIQTANKVARELKLPYRFKAADLQRN